MATETIRENLTPEDVETKTFTPVRLREGYDMAEVDHFLDEVVATLRKLGADNENLRRDGVRNSPGLGAKDSSANRDNGAPAPSEQVAESGRRAAEKGQMSAGEATSAAVRVLQMAQDEAEQIRAAAAAESEKVLSDAQRRSDQLTEQSRSQAARITAESQQRASDIDEQTRVRRSELMGALESERGRLANDVDGLRAFEREYRSRLRTYFKDQITRLDAERSPANGLGGGENGVSVGDTDHRGI